jgi:hypothetical protein
MRYIKLFENFDEDKIKSDLQDIFVELVDNGFVVNVSTHLVNLDDNIEFEFKKKGGSNFKYKDIKEYVLMALDYIETLWNSIDVEYKTEKKVEVFGFTQYITSGYKKYADGKLIDDTDVCNIKMEIYKDEVYKVI